MFRGVPVLLLRGVAGPVEHPRVLVGVHDVARGAAARCPERLAGAAHPGEMVSGHRRSSSPTT